MASNRGYHSGTGSGSYGSSRGGSGYADDRSGNWFQNLFGSNSFLGKLGDVFDALVNRLTGAALTPAEKEASALQLSNQQTLNEEDYQRKIDFYEMYESPEAMMRQYKSAGLNPALMYANGASVSASGGIGAGSAQSVDAPAGDIASLIGSISGIPLKVREMNINKELRSRELDIQAESNAIARDRLTIDRIIAESSANKNIADTSRILQEIEVSKFDLGLKQDMRELTIEHQRNSNDMQYVSMSLSKKEMDNIDSMISNRMAQNRVFNAQVSKLLKDAAFVDYQMNDYLPGMLANSSSLTDAQVSELNQSVENLKETQSKIREEVRKVAAEAGLAERDIEYYIWNHSKSVGAFGVNVVESAKSDDDVVRGFTPSHPYDRTHVYR